MQNEIIRQSILRACQQLTPQGLSRGTSGNVSARTAAGYLITPSGVGYDDLSASSLLELGLQETPDEDAFPRPSSEWRFHRDIYQSKPEVGAVVHAHPAFATALACMSRGIPAFHYMVAAAGGRDIRCANYATFGTQALSDSIVAALSDRKACLVGNHGIVAVGESVEAAFSLARTVEDLAEQYVRVLQMGAPVLLPDDEMERVLQKFRSYGKPKPRD